jgi:hypothetical protein
MGTVENDPGVMLTSHLILAPMLGIIIPMPVLLPYVFKARKGMALNRYT